MINTRQIDLAVVFQKDTKSCAAERQTNRQKNSFSDWLPCPTAGGASDNPITPWYNWRAFPLLCRRGHGLRGEAGCLSAGHALNVEIVAEIDGGVVDARRAATR